MRRWEADAAQAGGDRSVVRLLPRSALARELAVVVLVKLVLITLIGALWFSDPPADRLDASGVAAAVMGPPWRSRTP